MSDCVIAVGMMTVGKLTLYVITAAVITFACDDGQCMIVNVTVGVLLVV